MKYLKKYGFVSGVLFALALVFALGATAPLRTSLTANGMNQGDLWQAIENLVNIVNEVQTDHATDITWDTEVDSDLDDINDYLSIFDRDQIYVGDPAIVEGSSNTTALKVAGLLLRYQVGGRQYISEAAKETEPPTGEITQAKYGAYRMDMNASGTLTVTRKADPMAYDSIEDALLSLGSVARTANSVDWGYVDILAASGGFTAQTDLPKIGDAQVDGINYKDLFVSRWQNGLNTAATVAVADGVKTLNISAINADANGLKLAEISAAGTQAMDDSDTVADTKWGGWILVVDPAGTGTYALAADGIAGTVSAMSYATKAAVDTALDLVEIRMPAHCVPIARIYLNNVGGTGVWTAVSDDWDVDEAVASTTVYPVINSRVSQGTRSIIRPTIPDTVTAPVKSTLTENTAVDLTP